MRAYEKYANIFGVSAPMHPDVEFRTKNGLRVVLKWNKSEYRAYKKISSGELLEMNLGACRPEGLREYITKRW